MMELIPNECYHIFNQGNNKQAVFFNRRNYLYFLKQYRTHVSAHCKTLAYCLMPNHFHFLIYTTEHSNKKVVHGSLELTALKNGMRQLQSNYTKGINKQNSTTGSLFRQNSKIKFVDNNLYSVFDYIHQNPVSAGLSNTAQEWEFSSFRDYAGVRNGSLCDRGTAEKYIDLASLKNSFKNLGV